MSFKRVLVGVDGSAAAAAAAAVAVGIAAGSGAALRVVTVLQTDGSGLGADAEARLRKSGEKTLARLGDSAQRSGVNVETALLEGAPFEAILADAGRWRADLIVMGRTGRTGPGKALLGSEAERVLEFAEVPVLVVPSRPGAAHPEAGLQHPVPTRGQAGRGPQLPPLIP